MSPSGIEFLEHCRAVYQDRIDRFLSPSFEQGFRAWAEVVTAPQSGEKVQRTRTSEHAERFTDMVLEFQGERDRRIEGYQRLIDRIDDVLEGRAGEFLTGSAALRWVRGEEAGHRQNDIAQAVGLDKSVVSRIVKGGLQNATERNINSTSAAEEIAALPKEKSLPMQEAPYPCGSVERLRRPRSCPRRTPNNLPGLSAPRTSSRRPLC